MYAAVSTMLVRMTLSRFPFAIVRHSILTQGESSAPVPWWSITKSVLAVAVLRLIDMGSLSLDDRFDDWPFTIRQLLGHTSGLTNYGGPAYQQAVASGDPVWPVEELLERGNARRLLFVPGEGWAYSNIGYLFIRRLIERIMGSDLDQALRRLIFSPMRIKGTRIAVTTDDMAQTLWRNPTNYDPRWVYHGLLIGPPSDAVKFLHQLLTGHFLSEPSLDAMQDRRALGGEVPDRPWEQIGYGLGLMIGTMTGAGRVAGHSGAGNASVSALYAFLDLPGVPIAAAFAEGTDEGVVEYEALRLASLD